MTEDEQPPELEALAKFREWHRDFIHEYETELEATTAWLDQLVTLLAWLVRQRVNPRPISDPTHWPSVWLMDQPETREAAFLDPLLFDLARHQTAAVLLGEIRRDIGPDQTLEMTYWAAELLRADRPRPGKGAASGRSGVQALTLAVRDEILSWNLWNVREKCGDPLDATTAFPTDPAIASALSARLNVHPLLEELSDDVPSPRYLRALMDP
ncbi:hypothetical protein [Tabrizicola sp.]|uniref:hypothetical protein n=1 Tax=Tabrizicola sp. TaxID=2005166 RepID=UPI0035AF8DD8